VQQATELAGALAMSYVVCQIGPIASYFHFSGRAPPLFSARESERLADVQLAVCRVPAADEDPIHGCQIGSKCPVLHAK
jgi:hypothetical protein